MSDESDSIVIGSLDHWGIPLSKAFCDEWLSGLPAPRKVGRRVAERTVLLKTEVEAATAEEFSQALHAVAAQFDGAAQRFLDLGRRTGTGPIVTREYNMRAEPYQECAQLLRRLAMKSRPR